jgi:hypothetical protein
MGYELHIHRRKEWFDRDGPQIALDEWRALCASDPSLTITDKAEALTPSKNVIVYKNEGLAKWLDESLPVSATWFDYRRGVISTKNPDPATIAKCCEIAEKLNARVQGDDGEFYRSDGSTFNGNDSETGH